MASARVATRFALHTPITSTLRVSASRRTCNAFARQTFPRTSRRGYADQPTPQGRSLSSVLAYATAFTAVIIGAGGAVYWRREERKKEKAKDTDSAGTSSNVADKVKQSSAAGQSSGLLAPKKENYQQVYNAIASRLNEKEDYDDGSYGPIILRLAWHCSGTYATHLPPLNAIQQNTNT